MLAHNYFSGIKRVSDSKDIITLFWFLSLFSIIQVYSSTLCTGLVAKGQSSKSLLMKNASAHCSLH